MAAKTSGKSGGAAAVAAAPVQTHTVVQIAAPVVELDHPAPAQVQISVRLYGPHAAAFLRVFHGLRAANGLLSDGRHVDTLADTVRWLVEQAALG